MAKLILILLTALIMIISAIWIMLISVGFQVVTHADEEDKGLDRDFIYGLLKDMMKNKVCEAVIVIALIASLFVPVYIGRSFLTVKYSQEQYEEAIESAYSEGYDDGYSDGKEE